MIKPSALATAFSLASVILNVLIFALKPTIPPLFELIVNSQFYGAQIASQVNSLNFLNFIGILLSTAICSWLFGYLVAKIYNRLTAL